MAKVIFLTVQNCFSCFILYINTYFATETMFVAA